MRNYILEDIEKSKTMKNYDGRYHFINFNLNK